MLTEKIDSQSWQPSAPLKNLCVRAAILKKIRDFFYQRHVLEVETPVMSHFTVTDPNVVGISALFKNYGSAEVQMVYLQTSPEYAMKRLLAAGSGPIYQMTKAFRQGEVGTLHNPEFTMLEWYRPGFDHHQLMDEMDEFLQLTLNVDKAERVSYADLFLKYIDINPHNADAKELEACARGLEIPISGDLPHRDAWLDLLWTHHIEPLIGKVRPLFLYDFPASQAALAKIRAGNPPLASRFEVYFKGVELANGFHELQDVAEQLKRFNNDLIYRKEQGMLEFEIDTHFLAALEYGLPNCSGVALGIDRLVMLAIGTKYISDVLSFAFSNA